MTPAENFWQSMKGDQEGPKESAMSNSLQILKDKEAGIKAFDNSQHESQANRASTPNTCLPRKQCVAIAALLAIIVWTGLDIQVLQICASDSPNKQKDGVFMSVGLYALQ